MGRRSSQKKNAAMLDTDDTDSVSSSSTVQSDRGVVSGVEEVEFDKETFLDQCLDALYEKRGSTREKALAAIIEAFNSNLQNEFVEKKFATLLQQCLNSIKRGSSKEIAMAAHAIGLLALTAGPGDKAHEILEVSVSPISEALKSRTETSKIVSLLECLAVITFIGGEEPEQTEKAMQLMWQVANPKLGPNVVAARPSPAMITSVVSAWSFLLTSMGQWTLDSKAWQGSIFYFSTLLDKDDRSVRIAAGEALALIFEIGSLEKFCAESKASGDGSNGEGEKSKELVHIQGLRSKVLNQVRNLSAEAGVDVVAAPTFNPLGAKAATISLSAFGPGGPFSFDSFSKKWKKQKKKPESSRKENSAQGNSSKHEALGNEWLETGNCPIAKSYRAVSHVLPLVATALQPPSGIKMKCPPAVVAARAALARTAFVKNLRPQPLPAKMIAIGVLGMAANIPLGVWREHTTKFSLSWFAAVHAAVPFIAMLRKSVVMPKTAMALTIAASILGQIIGSRAERLRLKAKVDKVKTVAEVAPNGAIAHSSAGQIDGTTGCHCGKQGTTCNLLPDNCAKSTSPPVGLCY